MFEQILASPEAGSLLYNPGLMGGAVLHKLTDRARGAGCGPVRIRPRRGGERSSWSPAPSSLWRTAGGAAPRVAILMSFDGSASPFAPAGGRPPDGLRQAPAFPVGRATGLGAEDGAGDVDGQHGRGVRDNELTHPPGQCGAAVGHRVLGVERPLERAPLGVREADKEAMASGVRDRGASGARHDFLISGSPLPVPGGCMTRSRPSDLAGRRWQRTMRGHPGPTRWECQKPPAPERRSRTAPQRVARRAHPVGSRATNASTGTMPLAGPVRTTTRKEG
jgi:hypothetical protein